MRKELEQQLQKDFPQLFKDLYGDKRKTSMHWGLTCGEGWYPLIREVCEKIQATGDKEVYFSQVKEKFGGLVIYCHNGNETVFTITNEAEKESYSICEVCGSQEDVKTEARPYYIQTLCSKCVNKGD